MAKICFFLGIFPKLSETFVIKQMEGLQALGHEIHVLCDSIEAPAQIDLTAEPMKSFLANTKYKSDILKHMDPVIEKMPWRLRQKAKNFCYTQGAKKLNQYDAVIAHFGWQGLELAEYAAKNIFDVPFVTFFHGYDVSVPMHEGMLGKYKPLFNHGDSLLCVNHVYKQALIDAGAHPQNTTVHRMGIDCADIRFVKRSRSPEGLKFISVSRLVEKKGIETAIRGLASLNEQRPDIAWSYTIIGDGPLMEPLTALAQSLNVADKIDFMGAQSHNTVKARLAESDIMLLPSVKASNGDMEGIPVALMEAMASGLNVISTYHSGIPELITDMETGFLIAEHDFKDMANKVIWAYDNPAACVDIAVQARKVIEAEFDNTKLNEQLSQHIEMLLGQQTKKVA